MQELISPEQAEKLVAVAAVLMALIAAAGGYRSIGSRGAIAGLCGPLLFGLWQLHKYLTRFDPVTGYLGLDKVKVLIFELGLFIFVGAAMGWGWKALAGNAGELSLKQTRESKSNG